MIDFAVIVLYFLRIPKAYAVGMKCTPLSAPGASKSKRILFIGNSPNLLIPGNAAVSWAKILDALLKPICSEGGVHIDKLKKLPFYIVADYVEKVYRKAEEPLSDKQKKKFLTDLKKLEPGNLHHVLVNMVKSGLYSRIFTTNYDYCFEKALGLSCTEGNSNRGIAGNLTRRYGCIWHPHGEADDWDSIVMSRESYFRALKDMPSSVGEVQPDTWLYHFLHSEIVVCGMEPRHEELLFWHALNLRLQLSERQKVKVYIFKVESEDSSVNDAYDNMCHILSSLDVETELIPVKTTSDAEDWVLAWYSLLGKLHARGIGTEPIQDRTGIICPFKVRNPQKNIVASETPTSQNPKRCWLNISCKKLKKFEDRNYLFDCRINMQRFVYFAPVRELLGAFTSAETPIIEDGDYTRYSFYLEYESGKLFNKIGTGDDVPVFILNRVHSDTEYMSCLNQ